MDNRQVESHRHRQLSITIFQTYFRRFSVRKLKLFNYKLLIRIYNQVSL